MSDLGSAEFRAIDTDFTDEDLHLLSRGVFFGGSGHPMYPHPGIPITSRPENHSLIIGKTRAGKGINVVIPTLLRRMPKKPAAIDASTLVATKEKLPVIAGALQRGQTHTETLVDLNFKVPPDFRDRFKRLAFEARLKNVQLLVRAVEAWEREGHPSNSSR